MSISRPVANSHHKTPRPPREAVLILLHGDGYLEAFAEKHVDIHVAHVPWSPHKLGERVAEAYLEAKLPRRYADLHFANRLRATENWRRITLFDIARTNRNLRALNELDAIGVKYAPSKPTTTGGRKLWTL